MRECLSEDEAKAFARKELAHERRAQVKEHIDRCPSCRRLISEAARALFAFALAGPKASPPPPSPPLTRDVSPASADAARIGRYVVRALVGNGAMGAVYAAYDPELNRDVAVKLLIASDERGDGHYRLVREAQALARLSHPNVVHVYDVGRVGDRFFLAMELVHGQTLREWLRQGPAWREVLATFLAAGRGLAAAHDAGLVHRDFKPENVLVGHDGRVRVTDFGLAHAEAADVDLTTTDGSIPTLAWLQLTQSRTLLGTPAYMAPEQLLRRPALRAADQFSFCVALYEGLFGHRPFVGDDLEALAASVLSGRPAPPPARTEVPDAIHRALLRGLEIDPADRHASMHELLDALEQGATQANAAPTPRTRRAQARGRRWLAVLGLAGLAAGVSVTALRARAHAQVAVPDEHLAAQAHGAATASAQVTGKSDAEPTIDAVARELAHARATSDRERELQLLGQQAALLARAGKLAWATESYTDALALARDLREGDVELRMLEGHAGVLNERCRFPEAHAAYAELRDRRTRAGDRVGLARALSGEGVVYLEQAELAQARNHYETALDLARAAGDKLLEGHALAGLGAVLEVGGDLAAARSRYEQWFGIAMRPEVGPNLGRFSKLSLSILAQEEARFADAEALAHEAVSQLAGPSGGGAPEAYAEATLAWSLAEQGKSAQAIEAIARARAAMADRENRRTWFTVNTIGATVDGLSGEPDRVRAALAKLPAIHAEAEELGTVRAGIWASYALGRVEAKAGLPSAGATLAAAEHDAQRHGLLVIARLAASARAGRVPSAL